MDSSNSVSSLSIALEQQDLLITNHLASSLSKHCNQNSPRDRNSQNLIADNNSYDYFSYGFEENLTYDSAQKLFSQISHNDQQTREEGLDGLAQIMLSWASKQQTLKEKGSEHAINDLSKNSNKVSNKDEEIACPILMQKAIASLSRLCICCPFPDVRHRCDQVLIELKVRIFADCLWCFFALTIPSLLMHFDKIYQFSFKWGFHLNISKLLKFVS